MASANDQIGRRTEPSELPAAKRIIQKPATQFAQARSRQHFIADFASAHSMFYGMSWSGAVCCARTVTYGS
jgi:hypothetical protein